MKITSLLLGATAGAAAIGVAQAADLPMTKGEAVEYVKVCSTFGPGFFYLPGSDTCLRIGGEIRADYRVFGGDDGYGRGSGFTRDDDRSAFSTQGRIWFDARTQTDFGLLRSYFQINADSHPISKQGRGGVYSGNTFSIDKAFIQFGGLTAGYAHSFFGFYDNEYGDTIWAPYYSETSTVNLVAYSAQFGNGLSATLSIEDGRDHRLDRGTRILNTVSTGLQGGQQVPDLVGQLRYDATWGSLALQGALHQSRSAQSYTVTFPTNPPQQIEGTLPRLQKWGYAAGATILVKLPFIDGGHFVVEGQYADGATQYLGAGNSFFGTSAGDVYVSGSGGAFERTRGWSITAELGGSLTPVLNAELVGSYIDTQSDLNVAGLGRADSGVEEMTLAGNLTYTVVKGLTLGAEVAYTRSKIANGIIFTPDNGITPISDSAGIWQTGLRLKRVF